MSNFRGNNSFIFISASILDLGLILTGRICSSLSIFFPKEEQIFAFRSRSHFRRVLSCPGKQSPSMRVGNHQVVSLYKLYTLTYNLTYTYSRLCLLFYTFWMVPRDLKIQCQTQPEMAVAGYQCQFYHNTGPANENGITEAKQNAKYTKVKKIYFLRQYRYLLKLMDS